MTPVTARARRSGADSGARCSRRRGVTKRFGGLIAVNDVDLVVHEREIVGLIGPNGAGKTTFFNCLTGMEVPTAGEIVYRGAPLSRKPHRSPRPGMARTFQNIRLFHNMTALENVHGRAPLPTTKVGVLVRHRAAPVPSRGAGVRRRARELLAFVGLSSR